MASKPNVLITRPEPSASILATLLKPYPLNSYVFPSMQLVPFFARNLQQRIQSAPDIFIFTSPSAVTFFVQHASLRDLSKLFAVPVVAMGPGTALQCEQAGFKIIHYPQRPPINSAAVLALPLLKKCRNQTIYLIKGQGGSDLIYRKLKRDGANIANIRVYQRVLNEPTPDLSNEVSFGEKIDLVVCTSIDGLRAFYSQTKDYQNYFTPETTITCLSPKMHRFCQDKNLATLSIDSASNNSLVRAIGHFFKF